jgi:hypothetical protein
MIGDDPESYDISLVLSDNQQKQVDQMNNAIEGLTKKLEDVNLSAEETNKIKTKIYGLRNTIEEIIDDPQGDDYDESAIEQEIDDRVSEYVDDLDDFVKHFGYDSDFIMDFIDIGVLTDIIVNSDGYGPLLNAYDGEMFETRVNGDWYFVMRVD